jgi:Rrf2 family protein
MFISKKCLYALRAVFELSLRKSEKPVKIRTIADTQSIPIRFLEVILNQLKHAGYVESVRGKHGGYVLALKPRDITVGEIIKAVQGPIKKPADQRKETPVRGDYAFKTMWENVRKAVSEMCDSVSFTELIEMERGGRTSFMLNYAI